MMVLIWWPICDLVITYFLTTSYWQEVTELIEIRIQDRIKSITNYSLQDMVISEFCFLIIDK